MYQRLVAVLCLMLGCATTPRPPSDRPPEVMAAMQGFLTAFENLDWEPFRAHFDEQVCVFFPTAHAPERACGKTAVEARFQQVFAAERAGATSGPPYLRLQPVDLDVQQLGPDVAVVSFLLRNDKRVARRTFVFRRGPSGWKIVHLHGSNVPWPD